jgi:hypothetical protein
MTGPACLAIMADAGGRDQGSIDQRARAHHDPTLIKLTCDGLEQGPVQAAAHELGVEANKGGALRRGLVSRKATEPTKADPIIQGFGQAHVREVVPGGQQEGSEQRERWPARLTLGSSRDVGQQPIHLGPVGQSGHLVRRRAAARLI